MDDIKMNRRTKYTRKVLQDSLIELMKEKPISKITIKELCEEADINRSTFYVHYNDQYDLLRKIEDEVLLWLKDAIVSIMSKKDKAGVLQVLEQICKYLVENSRHLQVLMSEQGDIEFQKEIFSMIYQHCVTTSLFSTTDGLSLNEEDFVFVVNGSVGLIRHWLKNGFNKTAKEMAGTIYELSPRFYRD